LFETGAQRMKRAVDVLFASALTLAALPFAILIAVAIVLETRGPVFFRHTRIGKNGHRFRLWKFRTMVVDADALLKKHLAENPGRVFEWHQKRKLKNDPRVTRVGRLLRRSSLDELPQLWNVLRGDMSMVGPRPIIEEEAVKYGSVFPLYLKVLPGLTGLWQVSGRNDTSYRKRTELDSWYIRHWTIWMDLAVLLKTVRAVIFGTGAY
jgi:Undecaprenyl-phosphate galactose phosphotransferase WbaP